MAARLPKPRGSKPDKTVIEWLLERQHPGKMAVEMNEGEGQPSRWNTLRALRVLKWYSA